MWCAFVVFLSVFFGAPAQAHPMGTLSTNRSAILVVGPSTTKLRYTVDFAEVPSQAEAPRYDTLGRDAWAGARMAELAPGLHLRAGGADTPLQPGACFGSDSQGEGGLRVLSLLCELRAAPLPAGPVELVDDNFAGTVGWRELRIVGDGVDVGEGTTPAAVSVGEVPLPFGLPADTMKLTSLGATVGAKGAGTTAATTAPAKQKDALAALIASDDLSPRFMAAALLSALLLGMGHALSPGHGKTVVAAYLVGSRGTVGQALLLGMTVTATHVSSVLALGAVTLWLSEYVVAETLYPWIGVSSGLGVVLVGWGLFRSRLRAWRRASAPVLAHEHDHAHAAPVTPLPAGSAAYAFAPAPAAASGWLDHDHGPGGHEHIHRDDRGEPVSLGRLLVLGITGGAVPCPSALVVLLVAISLHRILFGMALIVVFSIGLAGVLMAIGVAVVRAQGLVDRFSGAGRALKWMPVVSAAAVMVLGVGIAVQSAREGGLF